MNRPTLTICACLAALALFTTSSAEAQNCRLQIRCDRFTLKGYTILSYGYIPPTNSCPSVKVAVEWSTNLVTWIPLQGERCVTATTPAGSLDETDRRTRPRRYYRVRVTGLCP